MRFVIKILDESGAALLMSIMFTLIINGIALTLFVTTSNELTSSNSQVVAMDSFNLAEAGVNIGLLRIKALMEANHPVDPSVPFMEPPFNLASEGAVDDDTLDLSEYRFFDLVNLEPLDDASLNQIATYYIDPNIQIFTRSIDGFFMPECSNPDLLQAYLTGAEPIYSSLVDTGENALLRGWRIYLKNDNDGDDKTAILVAVGYLLDTSNDVLYQKKVELSVYIHGVDLGKNPDPSGQVTSSEKGARTGRFRVTSDLDQPVNSYDLR